MSLWYKICCNVPTTDRYIKPIEFYPKPNTLQLNFYYCYDELILKINLKTYQCICYFNQSYNRGNLLDPIFFTKFIQLLELYFIPYDFLIV